MNISLQSIKRFVWMGAGAAAIVLAGCAAMSANKGVLVTLRGANEVPPVTTSASGSGRIMVGDDKSVSGSITTSGVVATAAHIHTSAAGENGPVTIGLVKTADNVWSVPPGAKFTDEQYKTYKAGGMYINVHSSAHKPGEIRGQIVP